MSMFYSDNLDRYIVDVHGHENWHVDKLRNIDTRDLECIRDALNKILCEGPQDETSGICFNVGKYINKFVTGRCDWEAHDIAVDFLMACVSSWRL